MSEAKVSPTGATDVVLLSDEDATTGVLERAMAWQLLQVRKLHGTPLLLIRAMWPGLVEWTRQAMLSERRALANPEDIEILACVGTADAV